MFHKILLVTVILSLVILGIALTRFSNTSSLLEKYNRYGFLQSDMHYESVEKSWGEQGLIFYQLEFPWLGVDNHADRMTINLEDQGMTLKLTNMHLKVKEALIKMNQSSIATSLNNYVPYQDFFNRILTSLAVLGEDEFVGDILLNTAYSDLKTMNFSVELNQEKKPTLKVTGIIHVPVIGSHQLSDLWEGQIESATVEVEDQSKLQRYINYAKSRHIKTPESLQKGILYLKNLYYKMPKISEMMR